MVNINLKVRFISATRGLPEDRLLAVRDAQRIPWMAGLGRAEAIAAIAGEVGATRLE